MKKISVLFSIFIFAGCVGKVLNYDKVADLKKVEEYDQKLDIKQLPPAPVSGVTPLHTPVPPATELTKVTSKKAKKEKKKLEKMETESLLHLPEIEDPEGFVGRRPVIDPFRIGEKTVLNLSYFKMVAGQLSLKVEPFVEVNGEKAYHLEAAARSNSFFSSIYAVEDAAVTYLSYKDMLPFNLAITLKETKQLAEARTLFDFKNLKANYWQKRVTKEHGEQTKKIEWDIKPFTQNVVSAAFYLRTLTFKVGKKMAIRVGDEGKNIVFTGEVIRKEVLDTDIGTFNTVVIKPKIEVDGVLSPVGDIYIWLTDDDRKFMVRAETKIKIGSIVAKVKSIDPGNGEKMPVHKIAE
jgi:hypothetical protein